MNRRILIAIVLLVIAGLYGSLFAARAPIEQAHHFVKINHQGKQLSPWQGPWQCVLDKRTGLLWEVKTDSETIHDGYWSYSWFNDDKGVKNFGDCYFKKDRCDTNDLITEVNKRGLCGFTNWRLPNLEELQTLVYAHHKPGHQTIDLNYFPHTKAGDYWTSHIQPQLTGSFRHLGEGAYAVNFFSGEAQALPFRNAAFVRLVTKWEQ